MTKSLDAGWQIVKDWNADERQKLRDDVPKLGFAATIRNRTVLALATETLKLARNGLARRARIRCRRRRTRRAISSRWRIWCRAARRRPRNCWRNINGPWGGSVEPIFTEYAY